MTAGVIRAHARPAVTGGALRRTAAPDARLVLDVARVLVAIVLLVLALAGMISIGAILAGPMPAEGPAPGFGLWVHSAPAAVNDAPHFVDLARA